MQALSRQPSQRVSLTPMRVPSIFASLVLFHMPSQALRHAFVAAQRFEQRTFAVGQHAPHLHRCTHSVTHSQRERERERERESLRCNHASRNETRKTFGSFFKKRQNCGPQPDALVYRAAVGHHMTRACSGRQRPARRDDNALDEDHLRHTRLCVLIRWPSSGVSKRECVHAEAGTPAQFHRIAK